MSIALLPTGLLGLCPCHFQNVLYQHPTSGLPDTYWPYPRALVEANEAPQHQFPVGRQGWAIVVHPAHDLPHNMPEPHTPHPKMQQTMLKAYLIHPSWSCWYRKLSRDSSQFRIGDVHWHHCRWFASVCLQYVHCQRAGLGVLWVENIQYRMSCLRARVLRL